MRKKWITNKICHWTLCKIGRKTIVNASNAKKEKATDNISLTINATLVYV